MAVTRRLLIAALVMVLAATASGCGYSLSGRGSFLPSYIRIVGVPLFVNNTPYFEVEVQFTEKMRSEFIGRGKYQVLPQETGVDAVLRGTIQNISISPANFTGQQQASRYVINVVMKLEFVDLKNNKTLWENPSMSIREEYDLPADFQAGNPQAFFGQASNALDRVTTESARTVVSAILEAF
jgi:hypothetical protein